MEKVHAKFARRLEAALRGRNLQDTSNGELARFFARYRVSVSEQAVSNWRTGRNVPRLEHYAGLAEALQVAPGELAFGGPSVAEKGAAAVGGEVPSDIAAAYALLPDEERGVVDGLVRLLARRQRRSKPAAVSARSVHGGTARGGKGD